MRKAYGFTLIEVMIALAVFGLTAAAIAVANAQVVASTRMLQEQQEARWVAENYVTELRVLKGFPNVGTSKERVDFNGKKWVIDVVVTDVDYQQIGPYIRHIELRTRLESEENTADSLKLLVHSEVSPAS